MRSSTTFLSSLLALLSALQTASSLPSPPLDLPTEKVSTQLHGHHLGSPSPYTKPFLDIFDEPSCSGIEQGLPIYLNNTACHKLTPNSNHIFVGWVPDFREVTFYADEHCKMEVKKLEQPQEEELDRKHGTCVHPGEFGGRGARGVRNTS